MKKMLLIIGSKEHNTTLTIRTQYFDREKVHDCESEIKEPPHSWIGRLST